MTALHIMLPGVPVALHPTPAACGTARGGPGENMGRWRYDPQLGLLVIGCREHGACQRCKRALAAHRDRVDRAIARFLEVPS